MGTAVAIPSRVPLEGESIYGQGARSARPDYAIDAETGCWNWLKALSKAGYPTERAHRVYYQAANGPIPKGIHVHHKCRNTRCVNPAHLEAQTPREHMQHHWLAERGITLEDVLEIRRLGAKRHLRYCDIAEQFGVHFNTVYNIWRGESWACELGFVGPVELEPVECANPECSEMVVDPPNRHAIYHSRKCREAFNGKKHNARKKARRHALAFSAKDRP